MAEVIKDEASELVLASPPNYFPPEHLLDVRFAQLTALPMVGAVEQPHFLLFARWFPS